MSLVHGVEALGRDLSHAAWPALGAAIGLHVLKRAARARAWQRIVLSASPRCGLRFPLALGACLTAVGISSVAPIRGAELVRVALVRRRLDQVGTVTLASTLAVELILDATLALPLVACALAFGLVPGVPEPMEIAAWLSSHRGAAALAGLVVLAAAAVWRRARLARLRAAVWNGLAALRRPRALATAVLPWLALSWVLRGASVYCYLEAFHLQATAGLVVTVLATQLVSALVPLSWAGAAAQQAILVGVLGDAGGATAAAAFGIGMQAATVAANSAAAFVALSLLCGSARPRSLLRAVQT